MPRRLSLKSLPNHVTAYKRTKVFNEKTIPKALLSEHQTQAGVWGKIVVTKGSLLYVLSSGQEYVLKAESPGVASPQEVHFVKPIDSQEVEFYVEFYRA